MGRVHELKRATETLMDQNLLATMMKMKMIKEMNENDDNVGKLCADGESGVDTQHREVYRNKLHSL